MNRRWLAGRRRARSSSPARPIVPDGPFRFGEVIDLASGASAPMPFEGWPFGTSALVQGPDGPTMAVQSAGHTAPGQAVGQPAVPPKVAIVDAADMEVRSEYAPPLTSLGIVDVDDSSVGVDLPPGWILMWGTEPGEDTMSAYAMNAADGTHPAAARGRRGLRPGVTRGRGYNRAVRAARRIGP